MKRSYILPIFLLIQIIVLKIIRFFPKTVEHIYSNGFYVYLSKFSRIVLGKIPLSIGDCIYFVLILFALKWFWTKRKSWKKEWKTNLLTVFSALSVFYFC